MRRDGSGKGSSNNRAERHRPFQIQRRSAAREGDAADIFSFQVMSLLTNGVTKGPALRTPGSFSSATSFKLELKA